MSSPILPYRVWDKILKKHPYATKAIANKTHVVRTKPTEISLVYGYNSPRVHLTLATITKTAGINFISPGDELSHKMLSFRINKFLAPINRVTHDDPDYLGELRANDGWNMPLNIISVAKLPEREMTADEAKVISDYKAKNAADKNSWRGPDYVPYYLTPRLSYQPDYWYGTVDSVNLKTRKGTVVTVRFAAGKTCSGMYFDHTLQSEDYPLLRGWSRKKFYKVMDEQGVTGYARFHWPMPTIDLDTLEVTPGEWHEVEGKLNTCHNGIHVCIIDQIPNWVSSNHRFMLVEMETGPVYDVGDSGKYLTRKARVKRVICDLSDVLKFHGSVPQIKLIKKKMKGINPPKPKTYKMSMDARVRITREVKVYSQRELKHIKAEMERNVMHNRYGYEYDAVTIAKKITVKQVETDA